MVRFGRYFPSACKITLKPQSANWKIVRGALRLRPVEGLLGNLHLSHGVVLNP